jgi:hypothetical protein
MKVRRLKDPEAPKRASSSFLLFAQEERPKILAEMGSIPVGEHGRELGRRWGGLEEEVKERFNKVARKDRERYKKDMETYKPSQLFLQEKAAKKKSEASGGSVAEYFLFLSTHWRTVSSNHPCLSPVHVQDLVWQQWVVDTARGSVGRGMGKGKTMEVRKKSLVFGRGVRDSPWMEKDTEEIVCVKGTKAKVKVEKKKMAREM